MIRIKLILVGIFSVVASTQLSALTLQELTQRMKDLPTVPEEELPPMENEAVEFQGLIKHDGLKGHTWVRFPFVENPGSFGIDRKGRIFVVEANRFWQGVPDLRGVNELIRDDFKSVTVEDRTALYQKFASLFPADFFTRTADRVILLEDRDGNGAADHRSLFSDHFNAPLDGLAFSVLPEDDAVYLTNIPNLWKMTDPDSDGVADTHEAIVEGFGARVSFIGHDLHGIIRGPDGRLYFSVGDRGYHFTDDNGEVHSGPGRGAIFRCESDGSGIEVYCTGLRNPQELAFDDFGNLFTFDNTGDIGDKARMVYALEGTDSGWDMAHQSAHHYVTHLDWGEFHPKKSMWVAERMFDVFNEEQPQWVYPPASHVARGPSGVTFLTGETLPEDLRGKFLLANYRGPSENCTILTIGVEAAGAGYSATTEDVLIEGVGVSDVELGYDGNIYLCDFGGGWEVNTKGAIQVISPTDEALSEAGTKMEKIFEEGFKEASLGQLAEYLVSPDKRLRQSAQFELVERGDEGKDVLKDVAMSQKMPARLHGIWGLGQIGRNGGDVVEILLSLSEHVDPEVRANAARTLGDLRNSTARDRLAEMLSDESPRVRSLAAIALGKVADNGDEAAIDALYGAVGYSGTEEIDPVLRHAFLSALDQFGTVETAVARADAESTEIRLVALLFLRRHESSELARFLTDADPLIVREAVRAIYDTAAVDGPAGDALAGMGAQASAWSETIQRRVVAANFRRGQPENARNLVAIAGNTELADSVRTAALHALSLWAEDIVTDPVLGTYRPLADGDRDLDSLGETIGPDLTKFLAEDPPAELVALALGLATEAGVELDEATLRNQIENTDLIADVRVAALNSLVDSVGEGAIDLVGERLSDGDTRVAAAAISHAFALEMEGIADAAKIAVVSRSLPEARAAIEGLTSAEPEAVTDFWEKRESPDVREELWLDLYLALQAVAPDAATQFASTGAHAVHQLSSSGGDPTKGEFVFHNQGACLQCHKVGKDGGIQGPPLTKLGERMEPAKIVEALVDPGAEIAEGYGSSVVTLKDGNVLMGRITEEKEKRFNLIGIDGKVIEVERDSVESVAPPISAMPPLGASLAPRDLRDLVAYLATRTTGNTKGGGDDSSHGEDEKEKIAK